MVSMVPKAAEGRSQPRHTGGREGDHGQQTGKATRTVLRASRQPTRGRRRGGHGPARACPARGADVGEHAQNRPAVDDDGVIGPVQLTLVLGNLPRLLELQTSCALSAASACSTAVRSREQFTYPHDTEPLVACSLEDRR